MIRMSISNVMIAGQVPCVIIRGGRLMFSPRRVLVSYSNEGGSMSEDEFVELAAILDADPAVVRAVSEPLLLPWGLSMECTDADFDAVEEEWGLRYPAAYRWFRLNYPRAPISSRAVHREGQPHNQVPMDGVVYGLPVADLPDGVHNPDTLEGCGPEMVAGDRMLVCHTFAQMERDTAATFDFAFDAENPPIVEFEYNADWQDEADRLQRRQFEFPRILRKLRFVADSFEALLRLPYYTNDDPPGPVQVRGTRLVVRLLCGFGLVGVFVG